MEICRNAILAEPPIPAIPVISKILKKNQCPANDVFGPFPDETVLSSIDRVLFLLGARRIQRFFNLPTPSIDGCSTNSDCSISISHVSCPEAHSRLRSCSTVVTDSRSLTSPSRTLSVTKKSCCPQCRSCASRTTVCASKPIMCGTPKSSKSSKGSSPHVQICESICGDNEPICKPPNRSFSLCSLACRRGRQKLSFQPSPAPKWMWTRMQCHGQGCEIFEVFQNCSIGMHPSDIGASRCPNLIFVVLPNGVIMPFETLSCH